MNSGDWFHLIIGFLLGMGVTMMTLVFVGPIAKGARLQAECQKDLTREFQCEMRFVKPEVNHGAK